ncbi:glycoside hydrolase family 10 [Nostoc sp. 3335mG]|nr:glycoside hydrolase family 10 [Nostoc sp. 3335mG]
MRRRDFVLGALGTGALTSLAPLAVKAATPPGVIPYGAAIRTEAMLEDPVYRQAVIEHCQIVVSEGNLKWFDVRPDRDTFDFARSDLLMDFAEEHGMEMRGHTLVWYAANPEWVEAIASPEEARTELVRHIETVVQHYGERVRSWDVVNEPLADFPTKDAPYRDSVWLRHLGPDYIELALRTAHAAAPHAQLVINEFDIEQPTDKSRAKRKAVLDLVSDLKARGAPLHAIGLQGHLQGDIAIDKPGLTSFVAELTAMGMPVLVTELDVIDNLLPGPIAERDAMVAGRARDFLEAIGAAARPEAVITWGLSDLHTWVPIWFSRADGLPNRPLPLDVTFEPKPLMRVIQDFTRSST